MKVRGGDNGGLGVHFVSMKVEDSVHGGFPALGF